MCVLRKDKIELLLANSSFVTKISHTSHKLTQTKIRGSFNGSNILREFNGIPNKPENFSELFNLHQSIGWESNLKRIVEATVAIKPKGVPFRVGPAERSNILKAPELASRISQDEEYVERAEQLAGVVLKNTEAILQAARIDNVNQRGNKIEQIITEVGNSHGLEDISYTLKIGATVLVDVKTKMLTLSSAPKGYNIDKVLSCWPKGGTAFSFFSLG